MSKRRKAIDDDFEPDEPTSVFSVIKKSRKTDRVRNDSAKKKSSLDGVKVELIENNRELLVSRSDDNLKLRFGDKMQYLETEIENNPNIIKDIHTLHDMAKLFGIKKFYKILTDPEPLSSKIRKEGNIFVCIACNKNYKNEPGIKYHVNGKCPKNIASYKCLLCNFEVIETAKIEYHIRCEHLKQDLAEFQNRGPSQATKFWVFDPDCARAAAYSDKNVVPTETKFNSYSALPLEIPHFPLKTQWNFTSKVLVKKPISKSVQNFAIEPFKAVAVEENVNFILNTTADVNHFSWLRINEKDGLVMSTEPTKSAGSERFCSSVQFWAFEENLTSEKIHPPKILVSKNCPFGILCTAQVTSLQGIGYCAIGCTDGIVRLIEIGILDEKFAVNMDSETILTLGKNSKSRGSVCAMDSFGDKVLVGYSVGNIAMFKVKDDEKEIKPVYTIQAHCRPVTAISFHPVNSTIFATSAYDRVTKIWESTGECVFSTGNSPSHLVREATWLNDSLALATENIFQDHTGVVNYDPTYLDTKFKLIIGSNVTVTSVQYNTLTGCLAFCDDIGRVTILSLHNPRKQLNMSRKGFCTAVVTKPSVQKEGKGVDDVEKYSIVFEDISNIQDLVGQKEQAGAYDPKKNLELESATIIGSSCLRWNPSFGCRSSWLGVSCKSGLFRIFDISSLRGRGISKIDFDIKCQKLSSKIVS